MKIDHKYNSRCENKTLIKNMLRDGPTKVVFTKKDGTIREMICTLKAQILQENDVHLVGAKRAANENIVAVYDLEKNDWRSFRIDSVHEIEPYSGEIGA